MNTKVRFLNNFQCCYRVIFRKRKTMALLNWDPSQLFPKYYFPKKILFFINHKLPSHFISILKTICYQT